MSDPVATLALCKWLRDRIKEWETTAKAALQLEVKERPAAKVDGQLIGFVTMCHGKTSTTVDEDALLEWVQEHHPDEIVPAVRPSFRTKLMEQAKQRGALIDRDGVVSEAITVKRGAPYPSAENTDDADIVIAGLLQSGALGVHGIQALPEPVSRWEQDTEAGAIG